MEPQRQGRKRKKKSRGQLRSEAIMLNAAVALIIIMVVLIGKVVSLNQQSDMDALNGAGSTSGQTAQKKKDKKDAAAEATATAAAQTNGSKQWIRTDLDADRPMVALTFDDGPYAPVTEKILATLEKYDARATFFCVASRIPDYTSTVQQAYSQGCQIASHTYGHVILTKLKKKSRIKSEIEKANRVIQETIGCEPTALRPPGGLVNDKVRSTVGLPMVCWSVDSEDWKSRNTKKILTRCENISDGDIVLMHDLYSTTAAAIKKLVPRLQEQGFLLVTVDELFYYKGINAQNGSVYYNAK